jgi:hypothetical protein
MMLKQGKQGDASMINNIKMRCPKTVQRQL